MTRDNSVPDTVSDEDVQFTIKRLHVYKSAMGDPDDRVANLIRVLEILYGVEYEDFSQDDIGRMNRVISEVSPEDAQRLDPEFVERAKYDGFEVVNDVDERVSTDGFSHVPLIGCESSQ